MKLTTLAKNTWCSAIFLASALTFFGNCKNARADDWKPSPAQAKTIASVCEGYRLIAGAMFSLKQQGKPRAPGSNYLAEKIADEIYSPTTSITTEELAKKRSDEICIPIVTESERLKQLRGNK
ncbi:MAG: hypothetical protein HY253_01280 [Burkholderiales bacterium]|nr:hypothetical protein [Burkholderiales bacterium]